jgi:hypothetical protein
VIGYKSFARKFLRCGVVAFADEASSLSLQNNKISVESPVNRAGFSLATDAQRKRPAPAESGASGRDMPQWEIGGPDPRNQPPGRGVTVTDWRLYTADHRHLDGGGNQTAQEKTPRVARGFRFSGRMGNETRSTQ